MPGGFTPPERIKGNGAPGEWNIRWGALPLRQREEIQEVYL